MSDESAHREAMEREKARLLEEAAAAVAAAEAITREIEEVDRATAILAKYGFVVSAPPPGAQKGEGAAFDGTVRTLIASYKTHPRSGYHKLAYRTRESYDSSLRRIERDLGPEQVEKLDKERLERQHAEWTAGGTTHVAMGHSLVGQLRILASFGADILKDQSCRMLQVALHYMKIPKGEKQTVPLTAAHARAIRTMAHAKGLPSIALAQAFQFEHKLGQRDVIGEWVPMREPGTSDIVSKDLKWLRGLRWNQIDEGLNLRLSTETRRLGQMVAEELWAMFSKSGEPLSRARLPASGPIIVYEPTGLPYPAHTFRRVWRELADEANVPKAAKNRDLRTAAGGETDDVDLTMELAEQK